MIKRSINCAKIFEKPFMALNLSPCSDIVVDTAKKFGDRAKEGILYHVVDYGKVEKVKENMSKAEEELEKYTGTLFPVKKEVNSGEASEKIMQAAEDAIVIVMGIVGRGMIKDILMGSTTNAVMRESRIPVLIIPC